MAVARDHHRHQDNRWTHEVMMNVVGIVLGAGILTLLLERPQDWRRSYRRRLLVRQEMYPDLN